MPNIANRDPPPPPSSTHDLYDDITSTYELAWHVPASLPLLSLFDRTLEDYVPIHHHTRVLELACGTGFLLRRVRNAIRPHYIVGVDISSSMIKEAQRVEETTNTLGGQAPIDFVVADCSSPEGIPQLEDQRGKFDVVMANFLFNYARTEEEMAVMWRNVASFLRPGGVFLATTQTFESEGCPASVDGKGGRKYGLRVQKLSEGSKEFCTRHKLEFGWGTEKEDVAFESFMILDKGVWERTAAEAGLKCLKFHRYLRQDLPEVVKTPDGEKRKQDEYWDELIREPFNLLMTARKMGTDH